ncbi:MAG TPA: TlyA family RNA methyltransferase [Candidatus Saccharimonadales bacterium]|nr:TlyA family RNA methyltransferase [Candidatus Saccharimonadales bacterium]
MKVRLDQLVAERGLASSRTAAQGMIMAGKVRSGSKVLDKAGLQVDPDIELTVIDSPKYVSRGGDKLASVAEKFGLDFAGKTVLDVGSSTGGFTDFALQHGAAKVYAVDVGTAQLAYKLRQDERVVVMEQTDIREAELSEKSDVAVIDVSFISLTKILPGVAELVDGPIIAMAKPQFEADKPTADRFKGVISDPTVRKEILDKLEAAIKPDFSIINSADSGVAGTQGNLERFYLLKSKR